MANELAKLFVTLGLDDKDFQNKLKHVQKTLTMAGKYMTGIGVAITGSLALTVKAAAEEQANIQQLSQAMANVGLSYDRARVSLEAWLNANQQATAFADDEQREALAKLITMTGDMAKSQDLLTLAMDISAGTGKDLASVTSTLGYALAGNWGMVNRMIPALSQAQTEEEKWAMLRQMFIGQASTYGKTLAGQMAILKNNFSDVMESLGTALIPMVTKISEAIMPVVLNIKEWIDAHPALVENIIKVVGAIGVVMAVLGPLLMALPLVAAGFTAMLGPVGLIIIGITALTAAAVWLASNWDQVMITMRNAVSIFVTSAVQWLVNLMAKIADFVGIVNTEWAASIRNAAQKMADSINSWTQNWIKGTQEIGKQAQKATNEVSKTIVQNQGLVADAMEQTTAAIDVQQKSLDELKQKQLEQFNLYSRYVSSFKSPWQSMESTGESFVRDWQGKVIGVGGEGPTSFLPGKNILDTIDPFQRDIYIQVDGETLGKVTSRNQGEDLLDRARMGG